MSTLRFTIRTSQSSRLEAQTPFARLQFKQKIASATSAPRGGLCQTVFSNEAVAKRTGQRIVEKQLSGLNAAQLTRL